jgi:hypothetical protein
MSKERPIIFSAEEILALEDGKTQVRKTRGLKKINEYPHLWDVNTPFKCPYGRPGDFLWVRETFQIIGSDPYEPLCIEEYGYIPKVKPPNGLVIYRADGNGDEWGGDLSWRPSVHMPRWASRFLLEIVDVRLEALQDIDCDDIRAEGEFYDYPENYQSARKQFLEYWNRHNPKYLANMNPSVWRIKFKVIDFLPGTQIACVPDHANGIKHPDVQFGFVVKQTEEGVYCRYYKHGQPGNLRTIACSELTPPRNLTRYKLLYQRCVDGFLRKIHD